MYNISLYVAPAAATDDPVAVTTATALSSPVTTRYTYNIPPNKNSNVQQLNTDDIIMIVVFAVVVVGSTVYYAFNKLFGKVRMYVDTTIQKLE